MKSLPRIFNISLLFALLFAFQSFTTVSGVEGTWTYQAIGTPEEYSKGEIVIKKVDGDYQLSLIMNQMTIPIDKVTVTGNQVDFSIYIQDSKISVTLNIDGDELTGKAKSYDGTFDLKGKRK